MIRRFAGLFVLTALLGPSACWEDENDLGERLWVPQEFTTANTCYVGDTRTCDCDGADEGIEVCSNTGRYGECKCPGCTAFPDCNECGDDCFESCMCQTGLLQERECTELCGAPDEDAGQSPDNGSSGGSGGSEPIR